MTVAEVIAELEKRAAVERLAADRGGMPRYQRRQHLGLAQGMEAAIQLLESVEDG